MKNSNTDHETKSTLLPPRSAARRTASASRHQTAAPAAMLAACGRLGEKLDNLAALVQALAQAWQPNQGPAGAGQVAGGAAAGPASPWREPSPAPGAGEPPRQSQPGPGPDAGQSQQYSPAPGPDGNAGAGRRGAGRQPFT